MLKKIAITQRLYKNTNYYEIRECLDINWAVLFNEINCIPIVLMCEFDIEKIYESLQFQGVILSGGNDLFSQSGDELSKKRDDFEKKLIEFCIKREIPLLGVCRGMQVIAEFFGSTFKEISNQVNIRHKLEVSPNSKYFDELSKIESVNSYANFFIDTLSDELMLSAKSDNIIRAIEHKEHKILGIMWHSERENPPSKAQNLLIKSFF
ncbi:gamma-glutamyl-gamma-aminobutyrate hydrolase family protein [Campylobacter sputorum subsp. sputorum]|nr:gamma-glutamyl-gamma-aminobutyrate hydrolase family protein [Campylobacter sputorum subsp. sputorum]